MSKDLDQFGLTPLARALRLIGEARAANAAAPSDFVRAEPGGFVRSGDEFDDRHRDIIEISRELGFTGYDPDQGATFRDAARFIIAAAERDGYEPLHGYGPGRYEAWALDCASAAIAYLDERNHDTGRCATCGAVDLCNCRVYLP